MRERLTFCDLGFLPFSAVPRTVPTVVVRRFDVAGAGELERSLRGLPARSGSIQQD